MKKWILGVAVLLLSTIALADERFQVDIGPAKAVISSVGFPSCLNEKLEQGHLIDVPAPAFEIPHLQMTWFGWGKLRLISARVKLKSEALSGGEYECLHKDRELAAILGNEIALDPEVQQINACSIRCGGVALRPGAGATDIHGFVELLGSEITANGMRPVFTRVPFTLKSQ